MTSADIETWMMNVENDLLTERMLHSKQEGDANKMKIQYSGYDASDKFRVSGSLGHWD